MGNTNATSASTQGRINNSFSSNQPVVFHHAHGENIRLEQNSAVARRIESFCKAIVFSSRPIQVNEKVMIKLTEISNSWSGALRLGFTAHDPVTFQSNMPKYACPDLTNRPGNWAKALGERYAIEGSVLHYFVNSAGEVFFGIDGEDKGMFLSGVDTSAPLWALIDIYGNTTAIEMVDQVRLLNNHSDHVRSTERSLADLRQLRLTDITLQPVEETELASPVRSRTTYFSDNWVPMDFHRVAGPNAKFSESSMSIAARATLNAARALVFSARRLETNEKCLVEIQGTDNTHMDSLTFGLTTCDPATLQQWTSSFPEDPECLMDRPEYWVIKKNVVTSPATGDELSFVINGEGGVLCSVNNKSYEAIMYVDATQKFFMFFDIAGCVTRLKLVGTSKEGPVPFSADEELLATSAPMQPDSARNHEEDTDCKICFENPIESAFCNCGHSMTCHDCGVKLFKSRDPQCPMCRQPIVNVIRIFRA